MREHFLTANKDILSGDDHVFWRMINHLCLFQDALVYDMLRNQISLCLFQRDALVYDQTFEAEHVFFKRRLCFAKTRLLKKDHVFLLNKQSQLFIDCSSFLTSCSSSLNALNDQI